MKKNVLVYGSIAGLIVSLTLVISLLIAGNDPHFKGGMWLGYGSMIVAFSLIFPGIKNFRDNFNGGVITFGKAFKLGMFIALIGSSLYVLTWLVEYYVFVPDFMEKYAAQAMAQSKSDGATAAQLSLQQQKMSAYVDMYKNPLMVIVLTYMEILPVGLVIALIAALILKRRQAMEPVLQASG